MTDCTSSNLHKASRCAFTYRCTSQSNFLGRRKSDLDPDRFRFLRTRDRRGPHTDFEFMPPRRDESQVRISEACISPAWTAQSSHNCLQATPAASARDQTPPHYSPISSFPVWKVEPFLQGPCRLLRSGPGLIVEVLPGRFMTGFSISPTHRQQAHDIASRRHTPRKGHHSRGPPGLGQFSRGNQAVKPQFRDSAENFLPVIAGLSDSRLENKQTLAVQCYPFHTICAMSHPRSYNGGVDCSRTPGTHAREPSSSPGRGSTASL